MNYFCEQVGKYKLEIQNIFKIKETITLTQHQQQTNLLIMGIKNKRKVERVTIQLLSELWTYFQVWSLVIFPIALIGSEYIGQPIQRKFGKQDSIQTIYSKMIFKVILDKKIHLINLKDKEGIEELRKAIALSFKITVDSFEMSYIDEDGDEITLNDAQDFAILTSYGLKMMKVKLQEVKKGSDLQILEEKEDKQSVKEQSMQILEPVKIEEKAVELREEIPEVKQELIEQKFKKLLPEIISRVKSEIQEEISERSRIYDRNQPLIIEDEQKENLVEKNKKMPEPMVEEELKNSSLVVHKGVTCDGCKKVDIQGIRYKCAVCANFDFCQQCENSIEHSHPFLKIRTLRQTPIKVFTVINDEDNNIEINGHKIPSSGGFDNLVQKGISFVNNLISNQGCNRRNNPCPFNWNGFKFQKRPAEQRKEQKPKKMEEKRQSEVFERQKESKQQDKSEPDQDKIIDNATYLSELGFEFDKCYQWANTYPKLSKEELADLCLTMPDFIN